MGTIRDSHGNEYRVSVVSSYGFTLRPDGMLEHFHEDEDGREEWTEPLWSSPVRDVFADWVWDLIDDGIDPRNEDRS